MNCLEEQQRSLLALLKKRPLPPGAFDEYLERVAASKELGLVREIALWWRALGIECNCPHTAELLKRMGRLTSAVECFYDQQSPSPYMEEMVIQFLEMLSTDPHPVVRAVAAFELALARIDQGDLRDFATEWDRDPVAVFEWLHSAGPLPEPSGCHQVIVRREDSNQPIGNEPPS